MKFTQKEKERLEELEEKAKDLFLETYNYNVEFWLEGSERKEWKKLFKKFINSLQ